MKDGICIAKHGLRVKDKTQRKANKMKKLTSMVKMLKAKRGQTLVEYGLILALVAVVVIGVLTLLGGQLQNIFNTVTNTLASAASS
jgi:pilus assembly protein Flp/PilA